ncbi:MAG: hypothetical protein AAF805_05235 [Planctomycetota bacterium]
MPDTVTWVHDEMLAPQWVADGRPAVFVFDEGWIAAERLSLKRIVFLYESALELPGVELRKGDPVAEVVAFAERNSASRIATARSVDPRIKAQVTEIDRRLGVELLEPEPFVELPAQPDLKRFSRYWRKAEKRVLRRD